MRFFAVALSLSVVMISCESEDSPSTLPTVTTADVTNVSFTSASSGGEVTSDGGATIMMRGVCISENHDPTLDDMIVASGEGVGVFVSSIVDLIDDRIYYVRAFAKNSEGTSYGEEKMFLTLLLDSDGDTIPDRDEAPECLQDPSC